MPVVQSNICSYLHLLFRTWLVQLINALFTSLWSTSRDPVCDPRPQRALVHGTHILINRLIEILLLLDSIFMHGFLWELIA